MALEDYQGFPGAVELLITAMSDPQDIVRENAVGALEHYGVEAKPAVPKLITLLGNPGDYYMYIGAATTLGTIGPEASPAVPALINMLQTAKTFDKSYAAYGLQGIGPAARTAVPVLVQYLNAKDSTTDGIMLVKDCIEALKAITLEDFGSDIMKWNAWWALNKATW
jgi:HEAT repeat protein